MHHRNGHALNTATQCASIPRDASSEWTRSKNIQATKCDPSREMHHRNGNALNGEMHHRNGHALIKRFYVHPTRELHHRKRKRPKAGNKIEQSKHGQSINEVEECLHGLQVAQELARNTYSMNFVYKILIYSATPGPASPGSTVICSIDEVLYRDR